MNLCHRIFKKEWMMMNGMTNVPGLIIWQLGHDSTITTIITMSTILKIFINSGVHRRYTVTCNSSQIP